MLLALENAELALTYEIVCSAVECEQRLAARRYDAILSDYRLPGFSGMEAFQLLQRSGQEIPFILVTGLLGEEAAVECIRLGMTDYVLKDRLFRLPGVLQRALTEFEVRRQKQLALAKIHATAEQTGILNRILQALRQTLVLEEVLQTTVNELQWVLKVSRCILFRPRIEDENLVDCVNVAPAHSQDFLGEGINCYLQTVFRQELLQGKSLVSEQIAVNHPELWRQYCQTYGVQTFLIVPLRYQQHFLGGISLHECDRRRIWQEEEISLVQAIADQCAIAIHQAMLYQAAQTELAERKKVTIALQESEQRFRALIENVNDIIAVLNAEAEFSYLSPSCERILNYPLTAILGQPIWEFLHPDDCPSLQGILFQALQQPGMSQPMLETRYRDRDGNWLYFEVVARNLLDDPAVQGIVMNCHDITERKRIEAQLRHDALHDPLTHLPNRACLMERVSQAVWRSQQQPDYQFAVLFLDLDRFKVVNDSLGHYLGDQLLKAIARRLERCIVAPDMVARIGGDEFVVLLENLPSVEVATQTAERLCQVLKPPILLNRHEIFITVSIGIAIGGKHNPYDRSDYLLRDADTAMYCAKSRGRSRYEVFDPSMHAQALLQLQLESDLRRAIERQEFVAYYQPIFCLHSLTICGFEALIRWNHPHHGFISPVQFIPLAEETGLVVALDRWILREACTQLHHWQRELELPLTMSVNLSGRQFSQPNLIEEIDDILLETGVSAESLKLEITESVLIENSTLAKSLLEQLQSRGIQVSLDDFGTGYSSLSYLHHFPIHTLKIDRSFVNSLDQGLGNSEIVKTIISLGHNLDLAIVAEGIEQVEQLEHLKSLGCQYGQGYWFSPPGDSHTMSQFLQRRCQNQNVSSSLET